MIIDTNEWVSTKEFSRLVGARHADIPYYVRNGVLKSTKIGRDWFIHLSSTKDWPPQHKKSGPKKTVIATKGE